MKGMVSAIDLLGSGGRGVGKGERRLALLNGRNENPDL